MGRTAPACPGQTYRLQFHAGFTFRDATRIRPYLRDLGVTHCYASPYLKARPGSTHGYDIVDHRASTPRSAPRRTRRFVAGAARHGMGQILDTVPNHMGVVGNDNAWWNDVLENGPASRYAGYFDIAWHASPARSCRTRCCSPSWASLRRGRSSGAVPPPSSGAFAIHTTTTASPSPAT